MPDRDDEMKGNGTGSGILVWESHFPGLAGSGATPIGGRAGFGCLSEPQAEIRLRRMNR